jgi:hypothetical protein
VNWTQAEAIALCREIERVCPKFGCHVALTGGCLYGEGDRKDCDILFYRIREVSLIDIPGLIKELALVGVAEDVGANEESADYGDDLWVIKAWWQGKPIDMFFPEIDDGKSDDLRWDDRPDEPHDVRRLELVP